MGPFVSYEENEVLWIRSLALPLNIKLEKCSSFLYQRFLEKASKLWSVKFWNHSVKWHNDTENNDTRHNDTQNINTQHNDTQHNDTQHFDTQNNVTQHYGTQHIDTQHNDTQHNDTQRNDTQHYNTQHNDTQHYNTQHNDTQHYNTQHNDTQHYGTLYYDTQHNIIFSYKYTVSCYVKLSVIMSSVIKSDVVAPLKRLGFTFKVVICFFPSMGPFWCEAFSSICHFTNRHIIIFLRRVCINSIGACLFVWRDMFKWPRVGKVN